MKPRDVDSVIRDRFFRWGKFLRDRNATPVLIMGLAHPDRQLVITTVEQMTDKQIELILIGALAAVRAGMIDHA